MGNMVTNVCVNFNYDQLRIDKALGNFRKAVNNNNKNNENKNKNNVRSAWEPFSGPTILQGAVRSLSRKLWPRGATGVAICGHMAICNYC